MKIIYIIPYAIILLLVVRLDRIVRENKREVDIDRLLSKIAAIEYVVIDNNGELMRLKKRVENEKQ
jgi:hypothetical protein